MKKKKVKYERSSPSEVLSLSALGRSIRFQKSMGTSQRPSLFPPLVSSPHVLVSATEETRRGDTTGSPAK